MTAEINTGPFWGQRHLQAFLLFLAITVNYISKFNAGVAIVAMTNANSTNPNFEEFDWTEMEKSYILSSFFWGYFVTQFPGGYLCRRFGAKRIILLCTAGSSLFAILPPFAVAWGGWQIYCGIRVVQGLFQGLLFPCVHAHLAAWCPVNERNRLGALANSGIECGTVLAMFLSGKIAVSAMGWPGISYISGAVGLLWCVLWLLLAVNSPTQSRLISEAELNYIETSKNAQSADGGAKAVSPGTVPVPWRAIMTSWPFWALLVTRASQSWGFSTLQAEIPSYMNGVLLMDMKKNALFSSVPYLTMWFMSMVYLISADILLNRRILSLSAIRKSFNSVASWLPAAGLIALGFVGEQQKTLAVILMTSSVGINAGSTIGSALNTIDLSPNHAGILMGIVNTAANVIPILTPLLVGIIVWDKYERSQWQIVFLISAIIFALGNLFYLIFGSTETQPWNDENFLAKEEISNEKGKAHQRKKSEREENCMRATNWQFGLSICLICLFSLRSGRSPEESDYYVTPEADDFPEMDGPQSPWLGIRHVQALLIFSNIVVIYIGRLNVSVALVAMTNAATTNPDFPEYDWNEKHKSYILSSFYWGYVLTQFPGGYLCKRFGAKIVMLTATFTSALCSAITPLCVAWGGWQIFCGIRIIQGLFQGAIFPCIQEHLAKWLPPVECNRLGAFSYSGIDCGSVLAMSMTGFIAAGSMGWPGISYVSAALAFVWCALWLVLGANNAPASRFVSAEERHYIESSLHHADGFHSRTISTPWRAIACSVPFNALLMVRCAQGWGSSTMQAQIPSYMNGVLNMGIESNALFSGLPYLTMWLLSYVFLFASDLLLKNEWISLRMLRRVISTISTWVPAVLLIAIGYLDERHKTWAIVLMTLNVAANCGSTIGSTLNTIDLSPNHAGVMMGVANTLENVLALVTPLVVGAIVWDEHDRTQWQIVFAIAAAVFFAGNLIYIIWGTAEIQPWNDEDFKVTRNKKVEQRA